MLGAVITRLRWVSPEATTAWAHTQEADLPQFNGRGGRMRDAELDESLRADGIVLCFAELKDPVKDKL